MEIRIFISSPGDVVAERAIAKRVIRKLQKEFGNAVELKPLLWEDMPLQSTLTFQEGIEKIVHAGLVDIAIFILWSRLGSPLGMKFCRSDGTCYQSGTEYEYEYEAMLAANKQTGRPEILAYVKNAPVSRVLAAMNDLTAIEEWTEQNKRVQNFIKENFYDNESHTIFGAYHQFDESISFEQKLTEHLRRLITEKIGVIDRIEWNGNPYVGLKSFELDDEAIFYGRRRVVNEIEEQLITEYAVKGAPSLILLGESGSGKSSLIKAGLLPDLSDSGLIADACWKIVQVTPGQFGGNIFTGIVNLVSQAVPALDGSQVWKDVQDGVEVNYAYLADSLGNRKDEEGKTPVCLFFFDQFEELFTDPLVTEEMRCKVIALLEGLVSSRQFWFIFSIRSDFYHKFISYPRLNELKKRSVVYDLPAMLHSEFQEIVEEPAKKAGLKWEVDPHSGNSLKAVVINDIASHIHDLPLVEFALSELYAYRNEENVLTFEAYEKIGRIEGAIVNYVDKLYTALTEEEKRIFEHILSAVITESASNKGIYVRRTVQLAELEKDGAHEKLINKLVKAHIFVTGKDMEGNPTLTIAHEMLISSWNVVQEWIQKEKSFISLNDFYENCGNYWKESAYATVNLIKGREAIREAEYFLMHWKACISNLSLEFIEKSVKRFYRRYYAMYIGVFALLLLGLFCLWFSVETNNVYIKDFIDSNTEWGPVILFYAIILLFLGYKIWLKKTALPLYLTVKKSLFFWGALSFLSLVNTYDVLRTVMQSMKENNDVTAAAFQAFYFLLPLVVFINLTQVIMDYRAVGKWRKRVFSKSFRSSRVMKKITAVFSYLLVTLFIVASLASWGVMLNERQEKLDHSYEVIDELFDGLTTIQAQISYADFCYINKKRLKYLWDNFEDELLDTATGRRDYQFALCKYNLGRPDYVPGNLDTTYFTDMRLGILAYGELGMPERVKWWAAQYKEALVSTPSRSLDEFDVGLIWCAEKAGAFSLVKEVYDSLRYDWRSDGYLRINHAHALLMTGNVPQAIAEYKIQMEDPSFSWAEEIVKDFSILRWLGMPEDTIALAEKALGLLVRKVYTTVADEVETPALAKPFAGKWRCRENGIYLDWNMTEDNYNLSFYTFVDSTETGQGYGVTRYRLKEEDGCTIMEELDSRQNVLVAAVLDLITGDELHVHLLDGSNTTRIYYRKKEE